MCVCLQVFINCLWCQSYFSYFSFVMIKYHNQGNLQKAEFILTYTSRTVRIGHCCGRHASGTESYKQEPQRAVWKQGGGGEGFENLKPVPSISSRKVLPPKFFIAPPSGNQLFKYLILRDGVQSAFIPQLSLPYPFLYLDLLLFPYILTFSLLLIFYPLHITCILFPFT